MGGKLGCGFGQAGGRRDLSGRGETYRNIVHLSLGGRQVRITLSNRFGTTPLRIGGVGIARSLGSGRIDGAGERTVTFAGKPVATIAPDAMLISDPVGVDAPALTDLAVDVLLPAQPVSFLTIHPMSRQTNYRADGDQRGKAILAQPTAEMPWHVLTAVDVAAPQADAAIVAFGDSITNGVGTTLDANRRWPNILAARLQADPRFAHLAVVDEGIGGNRILDLGGTPDGPNGQQPSGIDRWDYDALMRAGVKYIVLLEGVNDIGISSLERDGTVLSGPNNQPVSAQELIAGMTALIDRAHAHGIKVIGADAIRRGEILATGRPGDARRAQPLHPRRRQVRRRDRLREGDAGPGASRAVPARLQRPRPSPPQRCRRRGDGGQHRPVVVPLRHGGI